MGETVFNRLRKWLDRARFQLVWHPPATVRERDDLVKIIGITSGVRLRDDPADLARCEARIHDLVDRCAGLSWNDN